MAVHSPQYALALHTASPDLGLALRDLAGTVPLRSQVWPLGRDLSSQLHLHLQAFLQPQTWQDLAFIAVAIGPGGFTGTRMGVVTARTLAQELEIPLFGISSLAAIAQAQHPAFLKSDSTTDASLIAVEMPAQRGEVFGSIYCLDSQDTQVLSCEPHLGDQIFLPEVWKAHLVEEAQPVELIQAPAAQGKFVDQVMELAWQAWQAGQRPHWSEILPYYGQHPV